MLYVHLQFTRDALIKIAGSKDKGRDFVYWTEVKDIPSTDLATIERLWIKFSGGKFGYTVQKVCHITLFYVTLRHVTLVKFFEYWKMEKQRRQPM